MARNPYSTAREKPLHWVGSAKKDYQTFPLEVQHDMGYALGLAQLGGKHPHAKPWKGEASGVLEVVEDHRGDTYRAVYTVAWLAWSMSCTLFKRSRTPASRRRRTMRS